MPSICGLLIYSSVRAVNSCFVCVYEYVCVCVYGRVFINVCMNECVPYLLETDLVIDGCIYDGYVMRNVCHRFVFDECIHLYVL
jgi:hypothetical protein